MKHEPGEADLAALRDGDQVIIGPSFGRADDPTAEFAPVDLHVATVTLNDTANPYFPKIAASVTGAQGLFVTDELGYVVKRPLGFDRKLMRIRAICSGFDNDTAAISAFLATYPRPTFVVSFPRYGVTQPALLDFESACLVSGYRVAVCHTQLSSLINELQLTRSKQLHDGTYLLTSNARRIDRTSNPSGLAGLYNLRVHTAHGRRPSACDFTGLMSNKPSLFTFTFPRTARA